ncbi:MAG TPA: AMIN domain-containing protein, partial [Terriglobia bacterium]|nr:AMIN domain-containing protein [Terriglobia bacterium]
MRVFDSRKTLAFGVLLLASTLAVHAVVPRSTSAVKDVVMTPSGDSLEARITTTGPAKYTYFELSGPRRLVVDFHDLLNGVGFKEKKVSVAGVERVRAGLFQSKERNATRIVFDLTNDAHYLIVDDRTEMVRVLFGGKETPLPAAKPLPAPSASPLHAEPAAKQNSVVEIAESPVPVNLVAGPVIVPASLTGTQAVPSLPRLNLQSVSLTQQDVTAPQVGNGLMLASALPATPAAQGQVSVAPTSVAGSSLSAPLQNVQYTGELVSFDVRDLELKDFFRLISETSGINVVLDPNVGGTLPMLRLTEVPWDQALDVVLKNNQLGGQLQGNVLRIATNNTLQGEALALKAQADAKE